MRRMELFVFARNEMAIHRIASLALWLKGGYNGPCSATANTRTI